MIVHRYLSITAINLIPPPIAVSIQALADALFFPASRVTVEQFTPLTPLGSLPGVLEFTMNVTFIVTVTCEPSLPTYCMTTNDVNNAVYSLSEGISFTYPRALKVLQYILSIHPIKTPYQYTLSIHPIKTPYQYILNTCPTL